MWKWFWALRVQRFWVQGSGFRVLGSKVQGSGFRVQRFKVQGSKVYKKGFHPSTLNRER
jgi:hypothetical protein